MQEPLAIKLRPNKLDEIIGQKHLVGENGPIRNFINSNKIFSMILYGQPGIGKTSIATGIIKLFKNSRKIAITAETAGITPAIIAIVFFIVTLPSFTPQAKHRLY